MIIQEAIAMNSKGNIISEIEVADDNKNYVIIDMYCLKKVLSNFFSIKSNSIKLLFKILFKSKFIRNAASLSSTLDLSVFDIYSSFESLNKRNDFDLDNKEIKIILLLTYLKTYE
jgi:hypothetical protein